RPVLCPPRGAPRARELRALCEMPPGVVCKPLVASVDLPGTEDVEIEVIEHEDAAGTFAVGRTERAHVDGVRPAMDRMGPAVSRSLHDLLGFEDPVDCRLPRIVLGVYDVDSRAAQSRHDPLAL